MLDALYDKIQDAKEAVLAAGKRWAEAEAEADADREEIVAETDPLDILLGDAPATEAEENADAAHEAFKEAMDEYRSLYEQWKEHTDCGKCGGRGTLAGYEHVANGKCFRCGGSGTDPDARMRSVESPSALRSRAYNA